jgi:hypothetical protein
MLLGEAALFHDTRIEIQFSVRSLNDLFFNGSLSERLVGAVVFVAVESYVCDKAIHANRAPLTDAVSAIHRLCICMRVPT